MVNIQAQSATKLVQVQLLVTETNKEYVIKVEFAFNKIKKEL